MVKIFISYRRADSRKDAGRIYDRLVEAFGKENVFKDVDSIPLGKDFRGVLREAVSQCDVQLAIIGKQWLTIKDENGQRRLDNPGDFVRIEIETALQRDGCLVIPVLVDNALMPSVDDLPLDLREMAFNNGTVVRDDPDFHADVSKIIRELEDRYGIDSRARKASPSQTPKYDVYAAITEFFRVLDDDEWDQAREILAEIRASEKVPRSFDVDTHEQQVWDAIEAIERNKEYDLLRIMAARPNTKMAWEALQVFWQSYPDYDPDNLADKLRPKLVPEPQTKPALQPKPNPVSVEAVHAIIGTPFDWCKVPAGEFIYGMDNDETAARRQKLTLPGFAIAKYPITYSQFQVFINAKDGFKDGRWWEGLAQNQSDKPGDQNWKIKDHPRERVSWYDAMAFSRWLSFKLGGGYAIDKVGEWLIRLPTEFEWEKSARGTDGRLYPCGNTFDKAKGNTKESGIGKTTPVTAYPQGASPYGVMDMSGNVWEWCLSDYEVPVPQERDENISANPRRVLRGGSWDFNRDSARAVYRSSLNPYGRRSHIGFRVLRPPHAGT